MLVSTISCKPKFVLNKRKDFFALHPKYIAVKIFGHLAATNAVNIPAFFNSKQIRNRRVAQLVSALPSVLEVHSLILSASNVCSDFPLICVAFCAGGPQVDSQ